MVLAGLAAEAVGWRESSAGSTGWLAALGPVELAAGLVALYLASAVLIEIGRSLQAAADFESTPSDKLGELLLSKQLQAKGPQMGPALDRAVGKLGRKLDGKALSQLTKSEAVGGLGLTLAEWEAIVEARLRLIQVMPVGAAVLKSCGALTELVPWLRGLAGRMLLAGLRAHLDGPMSRYNVWWKASPGHLAHDSLPVLEQVKLERAVKYDHGAAEKLDRLSPADGPVNPEPVLYAHGGGFVCCSSEILTHSLTPIVRAGSELFSIDYPLAPEAPFPAAILSTLRAMAFVKRSTGSGSIQLLGDSAGGQLVMYTAALLADRACMEQFAKAAGQPGLLELELPRVSKLCSVYGFLDTGSWQQTWLAPVLRCCWRCYQPGPASSFPAGSVLDLPRLRGLPPTLLIVGTGDQLLESTRLAKQRLEQAGVPCRLVELPGPHGFLGIPSQWSLGWWRHNSAPATETIVEFFTGKIVRYPRAAQPVDWSIVLVLLLHVLAVCAVLGLTLFVVWSAAQLI